MPAFPWTDQPVFCLTCDVDWASEAALADAWSVLEPLAIKPTVFETHPSPFLRNLQRQSLIESGWHPNFLPDSSQGAGFDSVLDYLSEAVPGAKCFRSHRYYDVTDINMKLKQRGFLYDSNAFAFMQKIPPWEYFTGLVRFPNYWEDGTWLFQERPLTMDAIAPGLFSPGLTILSFHPMHLVMNSPDLGYSRRVKDSVSREEWNAMDYSTLAKVRHQGRGMRDFLAEILSAIRAEGHAIHPLESIYQMYREN